MRGQTPETPSASGFWTRCSGAYGHSATVKPERPPAPQADHSAAWGARVDGSPLDRRRTTRRGACGPLGVRDGRVGRATVRGCAVKSKHPWLVPFHGYAVTVEYAN